ncbi:MAG: protease inhibitor I42 family protein [Phycisphaerae bacterium]|nr:protease inhibitor I42 family protein [Phycisphaerae bacterium]
MKQKRLLTLLIAIVVLNGFSTTAVADKVMLSNKHDSKTVTATVGDEIVLRLKGNPTTGYQWMLDDLAGKSAKPDGIIKYEAIDSAKRVGAGGFFIARFKAVKAGKTTFKLVYARPWEKDKKPDEVFLVTLDVKKVKKRPVKKIEAKYLTHSHGKMEGKRSIAGSGHGVVFETPKGNQKLIAVQIFAARYGTRKAPNESFYLYLLEEDGETIIKSFKFPYSLIKRGKMKWYLLDIPPTRVPQKIFVALSFNPTQTKGVYLGYTKTDAVSFSRVGLPERGLRPVRKPIEWMVRAFFQAPKAAAPKPKNPQVIFVSPTPMTNNVDPKTNKIVIKFDRPMMPKSFSWMGGGDSFPKLSGRPFYDQKLTTCTLPVKLEPGHVYWVGVNSPTHKYFQTKDKTPADRYVILFATKDKNDKPTAIPKDLVEKAKRINAASPVTAIQANKKLSRKLTAKGWKLWKQKKFLEAEEFFAEAVKKDPKNADAWNGLGWSNLNQNKRRDARFDFKKCLALDPKNSAALHGMGWISKGQGKTDAAIAFWERSLKASPNATGAMTGLASTYFEQKDYKQAVLYYNMWLKVEPENATAKAGLKKARAARRKAEQRKANNK